MRFFAEISRIDEEQRLVSGYAATEQRASDGLVVTRDAMAAALDDYMEFANVREMHQPSAVGVTRAANVDDNGLYIEAEIVDDTAWEKIKRGVYKGFSIGAKVTERDKGDRSIVRGLALREISVVDRPADPGAKIDLWRDAGCGDDDDDEPLERRDFTEAQRKKAAETGAAMPDGSYPIENRQDLENAIRAYGRAKNKRAVRRHIMKRARALGATDLIPEDWQNMTRATDGETTTESESDEVERANGSEASAAEADARAGGEGQEGDAPAAATEGEDPITRAVEAAAAALAVADEAEQAVQRAMAGDEAERELPGAELRRGFYSVSRVAQLVAELAYLVTDAQFEADIEGDNSPVPGKLRSALLELAKAYKAMADEELAELLNGVGVDVSLESGVIMLMAADADLQRSEGATITEAQGERLQAAFDAMIARGWTPKQAPAEQDQDEVSELRRQVEVVSERNELLLRTAEDLTKRVIGLSGTVQTLTEAMPAPAKTAGALARAVTKEDDASGSANGGQIERAKLSDEDIQRALASMPETDRAMLLIRAAHAMPIPISHRRDPASSQA